MLRIVNHEELLKEWNTKFLLTGAQQPFKSSCKSLEWIAQNVTIHYPDQCWIKHP